MKYFSLIYGDKIQKAPDTKIIPAKEFSTLLDSKELMAKLKEDEEKFRLEVGKECETLRQKAEEEGFQAGLAEWEERKAVYNKELQRVKKEMEELIVPLAIKAAKKIVSTEIEAKPELITSIVEDKLKSVASDKKVTIYVNKDDLPQLEKDKAKLKKMLEAVEIFLIQERKDVSPGGCVIETEHGIINAQWEKQWEKLEMLFEKLAK